MRYVNCNHKKEGGKLRLIKCNDIEILARDEYVQERRNKPYQQRFKVKRLYKNAKDKENNKTEKIQIRVSLEQKKYIARLANEKGVSISKLILDLIGSM